MREFPIGLMKRVYIQKISVILSLEIIAMYFVKLICRDFKFTKYIAILLIINNLIS